MSGPYPLILPLKKNQRWGDVGQFPNLREAFIYPFTKPKTFQKVCGGWWWWLKAILVLSLGIGKVEQFSIFLLHEPAHYSFSSNQASVCEGVLLMQHCSWLQYLSCTPAFPQLCNLQVVYFRLFKQCSLTTTMHQIRAGKGDIIKWKVRKESFWLNLLCFPSLNWS